MLFNSLDFAIFLPIFFILYWYLINRNLKHQNLLIVVGSYIFYGWWDWRFLSLILISTLVDYSIGIALSKENEEKRRKMFLWLSLFVNLGFLGLFKYYNFFIDNFVAAFTFMGYELSPSSLNIILPVGISFYTFQTLSYTIDVYKKNLKPTRDFIAFAAFVSFFPQLVAGPIERAKNLLPQFYKKRIFNKENAIDGLRQMVWGFFKKLVIADNCAAYVNEIFSASSDYSNTSLFLGGVLFAFQIYGDFSGYSDIAIGTSKLFGFNLMRNFAYPYFSRDIAEFWRRWHISLSTWFRDYLYIPIGGSRGSFSKKIRNVFIIFVVSGFWHGANWTFIVWGALNALYFLPVFLLKRNRKNLDIVAEDRFFPSLKEFGQILITFFITVIAWIFFRAENITEAILYLKRMFSLSNADKTQVFPTHLIIIILSFILVEWMNREKLHPLEFKVDSKIIPILRPVIIFIVIWATILWGAFDNKEFIYFQF